MEPGGCAWSKTEPEIVYSDRAQAKEYLRDIAFLLARDDSHGPKLSKAAHSAKARRLSSAPFARVARHSPRPRLLTVARTLVLRQAELVRTRGLHVREMKTLMHQQKMDEGLLRGSKVWAIRRRKQVSHFCLFFK